MKFSRTIPTPNQTQPKTLSNNDLLKLEPPTEKTKALHAQNQQTCHFFQLPPEIRHEIYSLVLGNLYIRIEYQPDNPKINPYNSERRERQIPNSLWSHSYRIDMRDIANMQYYRIHKENASRRCKLQLLARTCRQMYADTVFLHFKLSVFSFGNDLALRKWMDSLGPLQRRALRRLDLNRTDGVVKSLGSQLGGVRMVFHGGVWVNSQESLRALGVMGEEG